MTMLGRRTFLRRVGLGTAGLIAGMPLLESLRAAAEPQPAVPRRLLVLFTPNGNILDEFFAPSANGELRLGRILQPLQPFRKHLLLLDGLSMGVTALGFGNEHQRGVASLLTGQPNNDGDYCGGSACESGTSGWATGASIDQWVAQRRGADAPLSSLELGVRIEGDTNRHRMSYTSAELPVVPDHDPASVYRRLFGAQSAQLDGQICVADRLAQQYRALSNRVSAADRGRLQAHLTAVEDIERRLRALGSAGQCPAQPAEPPQLDVNAESNYSELSRLQTDLLVAALRCDSTRIASLMWSGATAKVLPVWLRGNSYPEFAFKTSMSGTFHGYTHEAYHDPSVAQQLEVRNKLLSVYRWYADSVARLLASLQAVIEPDGSTLLDNTLVLWCSELASPDVHSFDRMPFVIAGGSKFLRSGRYIDYHGEQHTALLATIGKAMGMPEARFGHSDFARGPLPDLLR